jgi:hypothetical protein
MTAAVERELFEELSPGEVKENPKAGARVQSLRKKWKRPSDEMANPERCVKKSLLLKHLGATLDSSLRSE